MKLCAACGAVNDDCRAYCGYCAHSLGNPCPVCGFLNSEAVRYCGGCARDLLAAGVERVPPAAAVSAAPAGAVQEPAVCAPATVFDDLDDLHCGLAAAVGSAAPPAGATDTTQEEIDGFFQRLAREGVVEIHSPGAALPPPGTPRSAPS